MIKAIKIDVVSQEVYEVELNLDDNKTYLMDILGMLDTPVYSEVCQIMYESKVSLQVDVLNVDAEGLLKPEDQLIGAFTYDDYPYQELFGHGLIIGTDENGMYSNVNLTVDMVKEKVHFISDKEYLKAQAQKLMDVVNEDLSLDETFKQY